MKELSKASRTQQRILTAALDLVQAQGGGQFSLDAVAKHAGVSKGGLLYSFPSKHALIRAMVQHHVDQIRDDVMQAENEYSADPYRHKLMRAFISGICENHKEDNKAASGLLAAIADDPSLLDPVREFHKELYSRIQLESEDPELASLVYLSVQGIHSNGMFQVLDKEQLDVDTLLDRMMEILK
ncbi:TetR/AcrR family transcriptional regulator [Pseudovibrio sp. Tun.PSC04-5.I4]|uniref:TetR/AcrR family transcriptional regulator n=1 Tax=Pseudovibrio sp. Tun.PSC04-5.I4 TaxID=1798213 RepID=UPI00088C37B5|nr:TetR/AcrR family transcriptional regulator [Pseudovibrio sp. Tun.PSC04-5.I4]SDR16521.1 DNA-binding transcriptional regulator, AcrR family [Pseudovibrio sp. Tun.PSC04-5.I4]